MWGEAASPRVMGMKGEEGLWSFLQTSWHSYGEQLIRKIRKIHWDKRDELFWGQSQLKCTGYSGNAGLNWDTVMGHLARHCDTGWITIETTVLSSSAGEGLPRLPVPQRSPLTETIFFQCIQLLCFTSFQIWEEMGPLSPVNSQKISLLLQSHGVKFIPTLSSSCTAAPIMWVFPHTEGAWAGFWQVL